MEAAIFITHIDARHPFLSALSEEGVSVWTSVHIELTKPWFIGTFSRSDEPSIRETILLTDLQQVAELKSRDGVDIEQVEVLLVSPEWMNGAQPWAIDPLEQVWRGRTKSKMPQTVTRYVVGPDKQYKDRPDSKGLATVNWERVL